MRGSNINDIDLKVEKLNERRKWRTTVYTGDYVEIPLDNEEYGNYRKISILLITVISVFHMGAGFINNPGMYAYFVAIPYIFVLGALFFFYTVLYQLPKEKHKFRLGEVEILFNRMRPSSIFLGIALEVSLLGEIIFLLNVSTGDQLILDYFFLTLLVLESILAIILIRTQQKIVKKVSIE